MTPYHHFYPGAKVVCIDDQVPLIDGSVVKDKVIAEGEIYTISWVGIVNNYVFGEYLGVCLVGVDSRFGAENAQPHTPYAARRFRPLVRDKLATFRSVAAGGPIQGDFEEPKRKAPVREKERT